MSLVLTCANLAIILIRCTDFDIIFLLRNVFDGGCLILLISQNSPQANFLISSTTQFGKACGLMQRKSGF